MRNGCYTIFADVANKQQLIRCVLYAAKRERFDITTIFT